jgi:putative endonuclease
MQRGKVTAFIEVKIRKTPAEAIEAVSPRQARRISAAAQHFLARHPLAASTACRFDIVALSPYHWPRHIENAFDGDQ